MFERFWGALGGPFGAQKSAKNGSKITLKTNCAFDPHFYRSGGLFGAMLRPFWGAFFDSGRGKREFLKTLIFADSIALFDVFLSEGVENHLKNAPETTSSENLVPRASWKAPGADC